MKNLKAIERDKWFESEPGKRCDRGSASGIYLHNRLAEAWCDGWDAASHNNHTILGALDTLAAALAEHGHTWTAGEREIYEQAVAALTQQPHPVKGQEEG